MVNEAGILDNSSAGNAFRQAAVVEKGRRIITDDPLPAWAVEFPGDIP